MLHKKGSHLFLLIFITLISYGFMSAAYADYQSTFGNIIENKSWGLIAVAFWFFGLLLGLTPCAIPILLMMTSICGGSNPDDGRTKALVLSFLYLISLAVTYAIVGVCVSAFGLFFENYFHNNWVVGFFILLFILLAFSCLGLFKLKLPHKSLHMISTHNKIRGYGPVVEVIGMGVFATSIAMPCVIAPLTGVLTYIASKGNMPFGGIALFFTGIGFGTPLIAYYLIGSKIVQGAGLWQKHIKQFFGLLLMGIAIWLLGRFVSPNNLMFCWSGLTIFTALYMGALTKDEKNNEEEEHVVCSLDGEEVPQKKSSNKNLNAFSKMISLMILLYGIIIFMGALLGNENPFSPLSKLNSMQITKG